MSIDTTRVRTALKTAIEQYRATGIAKGTLSTAFDVFNEFPSEDTTISEGIYIARLYESGRNRTDGGLSAGGNVYDVNNRLEVYFVVQQNNKYIDAVLSCLGTFVDNQVFAYSHAREYSIDQLYTGTSERYRVTYNFTSIAIN